MAGRRYNRPPRAEAPEIRWQELLDEALNEPGQFGDTYTRFYPYSYGNQVYLRHQGCREPIAKYELWRSMGYTVMKGCTKYRVIRPVSIKLKDEVDEEGKPKTFTKFKPIASPIPARDVIGPPLPEIEPRIWDKTRAMGALAIREARFEDINGNVAGYAVDRTIHVSPVAQYPPKTWFHEAGHILRGHTSPDFAYTEHRGLAEGEAEAVAYLSMHELGIEDQFDAAESRAYIQNWRDRQPFPDASIRGIFKAVNELVNAGRPPISIESAS